LTASVATSLAAWLGSLPLIAYYFYMVTPVSIGANLLIVPALNAAVPLGFMAIFTGWRWTGSLAGWLLNLSARVAQWHARLEPARRVPDPPLWLVLTFAVALVACALLIRRGKPSRPVALALGIAGGFLGFSAAVAWETRELSSEVAREAWRQMSTTRDSHWLDRHPINFG
jgi:hypothetical protein